MSQYAILRFAKMKGGSGALEAHHERKKEKYASKPDIDTAKSNRKQAVKLTKQMTAIKTALDGINPLNAGKRRDEVLALLKKFFPGMEDFEKQVRKYRREIKTLETDKTTLEKRAVAAEAKAEANARTSLTKQIHETQLQVDYNELRKFVDALPPDIRQMAQQQQKSKTQQSR